MQETDNQNIRIIQPLATQDKAALDVYFWRL